MLLNIAILVLKILVVVVGLLSGFAVLTWFERRLIAGFQVRVGPNRVGPLGLLQPAADGLKLAMKEDLTPRTADRVVFVLAPIAALVAALLAFSPIPFGPDLRIGNRTEPLSIAGDLSIGFLFTLATASLGVYGIVLAGWSSGSKYSLFGGMRASAQMISYELAMGLALVAVLLVTGTPQMDAIVEEGRWLVGPQFVAFAIFVTAMIAETNRAPFDLAEAEQELVAGFHTEYSSFKFALFYMAEYVNMITFSSLAVSLFLGGWHGPGAGSATWYTALLGVAYFLLKTVAFMFVYVWIRATLPRIRYDRLMSLGWKVLLPAALVWVVITATWIAWRSPARDVVGTAPDGLAVVSSLGLRSVAHLGGS